MGELTLDSMLSDEPLKTEEEPQAESTEEAETQDAPNQDDEQDADGDEAQGDSDDSTGEKDDSTPEPDKDHLTDREKGFYAKAQDEKRKRQALEARLSELEGKSPGTQAEPVQAPDMFADPDGYQRHIEDRIAQTELKTRITLSQSMMRRQHDDYDSKEAQFVELAKSNPQLLIEMRNADLPAEFVYKTVSNRERFSQFENFDQALDAELKKRTADLERQIEARLQKQYEQKLKRASSLPPSGASSSRGADSAAVNDFTLEDILGQKATI